LDFSSIILSSFRIFCPKAKKRSGTWIFVFLTTFKNMLKYSNE